MRFFLCCTRWSCESRLSGCCWQCREGDGCNSKFHFNGKGRISPTVKSCSRACLWVCFFSCMFSSRCSGHKMISQPLQTLDCEGRLHFFFFIYFLFYGPKRPQLYKSDSRAFLSCGSRQKYHVCLSPERIYSADSLAGAPATAGGIRFSLYLFPSFFLLRTKSSVSSDTRGEVPSTPAWSPAKWD